ncbi:PEP-CTERM sorting domain-containing protein [Desulfobacula toluolica]|uniref:Conserved uncharacterized protein n=1 Tax=Desulfobacula toluolica (strain DSM 7467 / Tol2) TaxID=651182 RepID=K0NQE6_DESTT|nr:PEP-CTERM sorting domain-containing protein [Desulfobacula toluolica]CCK81127.1 conserved uncharacterized protein [Desulfobacula toluolica Tol2]
MKKFLLILLVTLLLPSILMAATEAEKRTAIDNGLAYLATTQNANGSFDGGGLDYLISQTGSALLAFLEEKDNWGTNAAAYQTVVDKGLSYLLENANVVGITPQTHGNPDGDGNGVGVKFYPGVINSRDTYVTGLVLPAIASSGTPDALVTTGPLAGRTDGTGAGGAWTYKDVVQNTIDYFSFGQTENAGTMDGGWRYYANYGNSDQSTTQWPVISSLYASKMGVSTPGFVGTELDKWINNIQYPDGGAGYYPTDYGTRYGEMNETGALLIEQAFRGLGVGNANVDAALAYINSGWLWSLGSGGSYDGNFGHPYAMWAIYKGLDLTIGRDDMTTITNLHGDPGDVDNPSHGWNWWEDYCESLVSSQAANGSWAGYSSWGTGLATPWFINILAGTTIPDGNGENIIPEPATMLLFGLGLLGIAGISRRKKN